MGDFTNSEVIPPKPHNNLFKQQGLKAWYLNYSPKSLTVTYAVFFFITIAFGIAITITYLQTAEVSIEYTAKQRCDYGQQRVDDIAPSLGASTPILAPIGCEPVEIHFTIEKLMKQPVLMYYELGNFYHNFFAFSNSRDEAQWQGDTATERNCEPLYKSGDRVVHPCGTLAWSMFNDTFRLYQVDDKDIRTLLCDTAAFDEANRPIGANTATKCRKIGIAWESDRTTRFAEPPTNDAIVTYKGVVDATNLFHRYGWYPNEIGHRIPNPMDEDFMVWTRTAAGSDFQKPLRYLDHDLSPGKYILEVTQRFPTAVFGGLKTFGLVEVPWTNTRYLTMGIFNLVLAGISFLWFFFFLICLFRKPQATTEIPSKKL